jgi:glycosyltransferase involved in cell wall biosynthesis
LDGDQQASHASTSLPTSAAPAVSVVIPCWNDAGPVQTLLSSLRGVPAELAEFVVADASREAEAREVERIAVAHGAAFVRCARPNRGGQMNAGAAVARGRVLLFHHADATLTLAHLRSLADAMRDGRYVGGAFYRSFDPNHRWRQHLVPLVRVWNLRLGTLWGDQSVFARADHFRRLGGFKPYPLMEDVDFSDRLRRSGRVTLLDPPILASARRHQKLGALRTSVENVAVMIAYRAGVAPAVLHGWYYRIKQRRARVLELESTGMADAVAAAAVPAQER